jgi:hypothetical protein
MIEEKDPLAPGDDTKVHKLEPATKTWFFQRPDGSTFAARASEAWQLLKRNSNYQKDLKLIGCSDGSTFADAVRRSQEHFRATKNIKEAQAIIREGEALELEKARGNMELPQDPSRVQYGKLT